jgi:class 3 adenylate cyclase
VCPDFRIGIHGGEIITSEEGDIRRNIGFYGETINIAARMEAKAKETGYDCVATVEIARACRGLEKRLVELGDERVKGIERALTVYGFNRLSARAV